MINTAVEKEYGNRLRCRVGGIYIENDQILLVNHSGLNAENTFWAPPGGGLEYGESAPEALVREFKEETGLRITIEDFLCCTEYLKPPLHALEVFFRVDKAGGILKTGSDPEVGIDEQIIQNVKFLSFEQLRQISASNKHNILHKVSNASDIIRMKGYLKLP